MPRDFSEDGAWAPASGSAPAAPAPTPAAAPVPNASGMQPPDNGGGSSGGSSGGGGSGGKSADEIANDWKNGPMGDWKDQRGSVAGNEIFYNTPWVNSPGFNQNNSRIISTQVVGMDGGGTVPDNDDGTDGTADSGLGQHIALALTSVDGALDYGRKLNGLPSGGDDANDQQDAAAMPMIPGNQSETPGPYKPQPKVAAAMPMIPGSQSETPGPYQPRPKLADNSPVIPDDEETS